VDGSATWIQGPTVPVDENADHVVVFVLSSLTSNTTYDYRTNSTHTGMFSTDPDVVNKNWSMISSSCLAPFFPYNPLHHALHIPGFAHLNTYLATKQIDFMLFLGDFIYIDLPVRFGSQASHYTTAYRQLYSSPSWTPSLLSLPWLHIYDDHEITNDWSSNDTGIYQTAMSPWNSYQKNGNPQKSGRDGENVNYYVFRKGEVSFFVLDTRRYRSEEEDINGEGKTMLGAEQLSAVSHWLANEKGLKVLVSSVPFTRNWRGPDSKDSWAGYMFERQILLEKMWASDGVVIISGVCCLAPWCGITY